MANQVFTGSHAVAGVTADGKKIVFTDVTSDGGTAAAATVTISPLTRVLNWSAWTKHGGANAATITFTISMSGNVATITPSLDFSVANTVITIMSIGV
jgi:hypothetical protein